MGHVSACNLEFFNSKKAYSSNNSTSMPNRMNESRLLRLFQTKLHSQIQCNSHKSLFTRAILTMSKSNGSLARKSPASSFIHVIFLTQWTTIFHFPIIFPSHSNVVCRTRLWIHTSRHPLFVQYIAPVGAHKTTVLVFFN